jgi:hypothetical protein
VSVPASTVDPRTCGPRCWRRPSRLGLKPDSRPRPSRRRRPSNRTYDARFSHASHGAALPCPIRARCDGKPRENNHHTELAGGWLPKLAVRVRFSSAAPTRKPRPTALLHDCKLPDGSGESRPRRVESRPCCESTLAQLPDLPRRRQCIVEQPCQGGAQHDKGHDCCNVQQDALGRGKYFVVVGHLI